MEQLCYLALSVLLAIVVMYGLLELHYFLRMCLCVVLARFVKRRCHILDATTVNGEYSGVQSLDPSSSPQQIDNGRHSSASYGLDRIPIPIILTKEIKALPI